MNYLPPVGTDSWHPDSVLQRREELWLDHVLHACTYAGFGVRVSLTQMELSTPTSIYVPQR
jgi:hypothetical protein